MVTVVRGRSLRCVKDPTNCVDEGYIDSRAVETPWGEAVGFRIKCTLNSDCAAPSRLLSSQWLCGKECSTYITLLRATCLLPSWVAGGPSQARPSQAGFRSLDATAWVCARTIWSAIRNRRHGISSSLELRPRRPSINHTPIRPLALLRWFTRRTDSGHQTPDTRLQILALDLTVSG